MNSLSGTPVAEHECTETGVDCPVCLAADIEAANTRLETHRAERKINPRRRKSAVEDARPVAAQTVSHVGGDVPPAIYDRIPPTDTVQTNVSTVPSGSSAAQGEQPTRCTIAPETGRLGSLIPTVVDNGTPREKASRVSSLQLPLEGVGPAHLSDVTVARGFILAGNAYFTVRSTKTGTRYTYRVSRADCSRCGKKDCQCWLYPRYFVSLLTGPNNTEDYQYLGMLGDRHEFRATRATGARENSTPFKAFAWVWRALNSGAMPQQTEIWHEGRCGRCGWRLTVPESVERGIGPECAAKGGF